MMKAKLARGQAGAPVVHAEVLKDEHGAPVVEGRFFKPRVAVEIRRDAGAEAVLEGGRGVEAHQHLMGDLRVTRLIGAHQAEAVAAEDRRHSINDEEDGEDYKDRSFTNGGPIRQSSPSILLVDRFRSSDSNAVSTSSGSPMGCRNARCMRNPFGLVRE